MKSDEKNMEEILKRHLPLPSQEETEADCNHVWTYLQSKAGDRVQEIGSTDSAFLSKPSWHRRAMVYAAAAVLLTVSIATAIVWRRSEAVAVVEHVDNSLYRVVEGQAQPISARDKLEIGETVRTSGPGAVFSLADGSIVEMRSDSELWLERADDGVRIRLNGGSIIVTAVHQQNGHLYVQTRDTTITVVGTVFLVNAEEKGSRVAVIQGEVGVQQGTTSKKVHQGEEIATNPIMQSVPVIEEILWSRNAATHLALLQQSLELLQQSVLFAIAGPQTSAGAAEAFELASVKPSSPRADVPGECGWRTLQVDPGRFVIDAPLYFIIALAYDHEKGCGVVRATDRISGVPGWMRSEWFEVQAIIPPGSPKYTRLQVVNGEAPTLQMMMQTLLADRFKLAVHREMREMPVYVLTLGKGGPKFVDWTDEEIRLRGYLDPPRDGFSKIGGRKASMANLADSVANATRRPVIDRTGLTGAFNYVADYVPLNNNGVVDVPGPSIFTAIEEQLGLKLEAARAPVEVLVIDHVEKPSEN